MKERLKLSPGNWFRGEFHEDRSWMRTDMTKLIKAVEIMRYSLVVISDAAKTDGDLCVKEAQKSLAEAETILGAK
jgi:hypothetical protein